MMHSSWVMMYAKNTTETTGDTNDIAESPITEAVMTNSTWMGENTCILITMAEARHKFKLEKKKVAVKNAKFN
jgi:hypothetical protein